MKVEEHVPLAPRTTFEIGGSARFFISVHSVEEMVEAVQFAHERDLSLFILGGGSNVVIADNGFEGVVIAMKIPGIAIEEGTDRSLITVGAGVVWDEFVLWSIAQQFAGLECMSGVPGTVGGAVVANLGAYGAQVSDSFVHAHALDTEHMSAGIRVIQKDECDFAYHDSMFGHTSGRYILLSATFALSRDPASLPSYKDNRFDMTKLSERLGHAPSQLEVRDAVLNMREEKGSLIMPGRVSFKCAGSFFHMPFVSASEYHQIEMIAQQLDAAAEERLRPWFWKQTDGRYKIAPGFLLEYTEFKKGFVRGDVGISPRHTLTIINVANARAQSIAALARDMRSAVEKIFSISLEQEVEYIGELESYPHTHA